jgi:fatty-acyl-CoA synthase
VIITGGFNVYPKEVEDVLAGHPDVAIVAVIGLPHDKWGEAVTAVVVPRTGADLDVRELTGLVRERKGPVHAPKEIRVVDELPLTAVGKVDKKVLKETYWSTRDRRVG